MVSLLDLDIEDLDIPITDLRDVARVMERLRDCHRLRIKRRNETVGVLIAADAWRELQEMYRALQSELDARDDEALAALIATRLSDEHEPFVRGSQETAADVVHGYEAIMAQRRARQAPAG